MEQGFGYFAVVLEPLPTRIGKLDECGAVVIKGRSKGYEDLTIRGLPEATRGLGGIQIWE